MPRELSKAEPSRMRATPFPSGGWASRVARLLVLEMVLWPGLLLVGGTLLVAYHLLGHPVAWPFIAVATAFSVAVGVRQWSVMLRAVFPAPAHREPALHQHPGEDSPRLTGRGTTEG